MVLSKKGLCTIILKRSHSATKYNYLVSFLVLPSLTIPSHYIILMDKEINGSSYSDTSVTVEKHFTMMLL